MEKPIFVGSSGIACTELPETSSTDVVRQRDDIELWARTSKDVEKIAQRLGLTHEKAIEKHIVNTLARWPQGNLDMLIQARPADNLAHRAIKQGQETRVLKEELIKTDRVLTQQEKEGIRKGTKT